MDRSDECGRRKPAKRRYLWCAAAALGLAAAGCSHTPVTQAKDPLLEPPVVPVPSDPKAPPGPPPTQQGSAGVPPIPTTLSATNTATLAILPGSRPLSIPERT